MKIIAKNSLSRKTISKLLWEERLLQDSYDVGLVEFSEDIKLEEVRTTVRLESR